MSTLTLYQQGDMRYAYTWYGNVTTANSTTVSITDYRGKTATYSGYGFTYSGEDVTGGTVTGYSQYVAYSLAYTVTGASVPAVEVAKYVNSNDQLSLQQLILSENDSLGGSAFADGLLGYSGRDSIKGNGGNDYIDGGSGIDTAVFDGRSTEYTISRSSGATTVSDKVAYRDGSDSLQNVEILQFTDQSLTFAQIDAAQNSKAVFRFYNTVSNTHFYTASATEADSVVRNMDGFNYEGVAFARNPSFSDHSLDVFRFYNTATGTHFYTGSIAEKNAVLASLPSFNYEGVAYQAHAQQDAGTTALYRFFNTLTGTHFYTASEAEMNNVKASLAGVYNFEGVAYYVDTV